MSTTKSPEVAFDYSGGAKTVGSIMTIDFDMRALHAFLAGACTPSSFGRHAFLVGQELARRERHAL